MARSLIALLLTTLAVSPVAADDGGKPSHDEAEARRRLVLLVEDGPLVVDLRVYLDGEPYRRARGALVDEILAAADTDGDGRPTWGEAVLNRRMPYVRLSRQGNASVKAFDANANQTMERSEAAAAVARFGGGPAFTIRTIGDAGQPPVLESVDADGDGVLSKEELASLERRLKRLDANDDDVIEFAEMTGSPYRVGRRFVGRRQAGQAPTPFARPADSNDELQALHAALVARYGGDDRKLEASELPAGSTFLAELDVNDNGRLDPEETPGVRNLRPQAVLRVDLSRDRHSVRLQSSTAPLDASSVSRKGVPRLTAALPTGRLQVSAEPEGATSNYERTAQSILDRADTDDNGYLTVKELEKSQAGRAYKRQFETWDANEDGKVYADEIQATYERQFAPRRSQVVLAAQRRQPSLFDALDTSADGRLSLRELREGPQALAALDRDSDGRIGRDELKVEYLLAVGRATSSFAYANASRRRPANANPAVDGPRWFTAMDRNRDGDLTPREFPGTPQQFRKLDANGDGFVDADEADAATPRRRR